MDETTIRIVAGILCLVCVAALILRRRAKKKKASEDEF